MSTFRLERELPPILVDVALLTRLEQHLRISVGAISTPLPKRDPNPQFSLAITDTFGIEKFSTVAEYGLPTLPETTESIGVSFDNGFAFTASVDTELSFSVVRENSRMRITITGDRARELTVGLADGINRILESNKLGHRLLHPGRSGDFIRFMCGWTALSVAGLLLARGLLPYALLASLVAIAAVSHWYAATRLRPYTVFDSRASQRNAATWNWFVYAMLGFLLFTTALTLLRKYLFGE